MAGDWIKMRTSLLTNPRVNGMARMLENDKLVSEAMSTGYNGVMREIVTRNVMRHVTVSSLLVVWGAANEHTHDGIFNNADLSDIDDMTGIPGFGEAMVSVGWATYDAENQIVTLPNFNEYNTSGSERSATAKSGAERQKEYRERKSLQNSDVTRDVTNDVTSNRREEKIREENKEEKIKTKRKAKTASPSAMPVVLPDWLPEKPWNDFLAMRKEIKKPVTEHGIPLAIKKLADLRADGHDPQAVLENSTMNNYQGLFPPPASHRSASGVGVAVGLGAAGQATAAAAQEWLEGGAA